MKLKQKQRNTCVFLPIIYRVSGNRCFKEYTAKVGENTTSHVAHFDDLFAQKPFNTTLCKRGSRNFSANMNNKT